MELEMEMETGKGTDLGNGEGKRGRWRRGGVGRRRGRKLGGCEVGRL